MRPRRDPGTGRRIDAMTQTRFVTTTIARPWREVYAYASDPRHLVDWAGGLAKAQVEPVPDRPGTLIADSPTGRVEVDVVPENEFGVLDHVVRLPTGWRRRTRCGWSPS